VALSRVTALNELTLLPSEQTFTLTQIIVYLEVHLQFLDSKFRLMIPFLVLALSHLTILSLSPTLPLLWLIY